MEDFQVYFEEADVVDLCFLLRVSYGEANMYHFLELTFIQIPGAGTLLDRLHGPVAAIRWLLHRTGQHPTNFHRPPSCPLVVVGNDAGRLLQPTRSLDFPSIFCLLRRHRAIYLGRDTRPQVCSILLRRLQRNGKPNPVQLGEPHARRQLWRARSHHFFDDDVRLLHADLDSSLHLPYSAGPTIPERISGKSFVKFPGATQRQPANLNHSVGRCGVRICDVGNFDGRNILHEPLEGQIS